MESLILTFSFLFNEYGTSNWMKKGKNVMSGGAEDKPKPSLSEIHNTLDFHDVILLGVCACIVTSPRFLNKKTGFGLKHTFFTTF